MRTETLLVGLVALVLILLSGLSVGESHSSLGTAGFTVLALNACWLFDGIGEEAFYTAPQCEEDAEDHLTKVATYLGTVDADFIAIEEIESAAMLHRLNVKLGGQYHEIFVEGTDDSTGQDVAALSRVPVVAMGRSAATQRYPIPGSSFRAPMGTEDVAKNYWASIELGSETITFIGVHLLAYPDDLQRAVRREAQALIIGNLAKDFLNAGHQVVILGDINDFDSFVCDAAGNEPISCVDELLKDIDPEIEGDELVNIAASLPQDERYSYWYDINRNGIDDGAEEHSMIDHMFVTQGLADTLIDVRIDHAGYAARTVSDHWPIIATFAIP
ncbi:endonuclease/exonuclease/phosphatase family protein [Candidatus Bipolaricaulota bacterium]|nr:endonuclease/exonuclease/phosphatase family protein [Candidatus Bipolaricaulota bacterium]